MPGQPQPLVTQQSITGIPGVLVTACKLWQWYPCTVMEDARAAMLEHSATITKQCCSHSSQKEATRDRSMAKSKDPPKNSGLLLLSSLTGRRICLWEEKNILLQKEREGEWQKELGKCHKSKQQNKSTNSHPHTSLQAASCQQYHPQCYPQLFTPLSVPC